MTDSWKTNKEMKRENSGDRVSRFFVLGREYTFKKKILLIPFLMLFFVSSTCPVVAFDKKDLEKLKSKKECVKCDLRQANLSEENLEGANLEGANLSRANLTDADLSGANLIGADLRRADIFDSDLTDANLKGAKLSFGDLGALVCHTVMPDGKEDNSGCEK